jgi:hypothetical protein
VLLDKSGVALGGQLTINDLGFHISFKFDVIVEASSFEKRVEMGEKGYYTHSHFCKRHPFGEVIVLGGLNQRTSHD